MLLDHSISAVENEGESSCGIADSYTSVRIEDFGEVKSYSRLEEYIFEEVLSLFSR